MRRLHVVIGIFFIIWGLIGFYSFLSNLKPTFKVIKDTNKLSVEQYSNFIRSFVHDKYLEEIKRNLLIQATQNLYNKLTRFTEKWGKNLFYLLSGFFILGILWIITGILLLTGKRRVVFILIILCLLSLINYIGLFAYIIGFPKQLGKIYAEFFRIFYAVYNITFTEDLFMMNFGLNSQVYFIIFWNAFFNISIPLFTIIILKTTKSSFEKHR